MPPSSQPVSTLLVRVRTQVCALPLQDLVETMRPLPVAALPGLPGFVQGLARIRGGPVPVVDLGALLELGAPPRPSRWVTLAARGSSRMLALAVEEVLGVKAVAPEALLPLPPLTAASSQGAISRVSSTEETLLLLLRTGRLLPEELWTQLAREVGPQE